MSQWKASGTVGRPPYKDYRKRGISTGSISTLGSVSSSQGPVELGPSMFYNKDYADIERRENISKIMEQNEQMSKKKKGEGGEEGQPFRLGKYFCQELFTTNKQQQQRGSYQRLGAKTAEKKSGKWSI